MENTLERPRKWRWGVNRWWILLFTILMWAGIRFVAKPALMHIQVAPEKLSETPLFTLPVIGPLYISNTLTTNLLVVVLMVLIAYIVKRTIDKGELVPGGISGVMEMLVEVMYNLTESTAGGKWAKRIFPWFATFLLYIAIANLVRLLPIFETFGVLHHVEGGVGNPVQTIWGMKTVLPGEVEGGYILAPFFRGMATDLNFTVALALISVVATQIIGVTAQGGRYFTKFFNYTTLFKKPWFGAIDFAVGLLETISTLALILSFSFRLFGNIFAGAVLLALISFLMPVFMPSLILTFEFAIGLVQAFVFGMLTMVFMSQATTGHASEGEHQD